MLSFRASVDCVTVGGPDPGVNCFFPFNTTTSIWPLVATSTSSNFLSVWKFSPSWCKHIQLPRSSLWTSRILTLHEVGPPSSITLWSPWHTEVVASPSWMAHCFPPWGEVHTHRNHGKFDSHDRATDSPSRTIVDFSGELLTICILDIVTGELIIKRRRQELHNGIHNGIHMA